MPKFKEPEVEVKFISNCFAKLYFWSIEEAGKIGYTSALVYFLYVSKRLIRLLQLQRRRRRLQ